VVGAGKHLGDAFSRRSRVEAVGLQGAASAAVCCVEGGQGGGGGRGGVVCSRQQARRKRAGRDKRLEGGLDEQQASFRQ
jgi:hypothetical protein